MEANYNCILKSFIEIENTLKTLDAKIQNAKEEIKNSVKANKEEAAQNTYKKIVMEFKNNAWTYRKRELLRTYNKSTINEEFWSDATFFGVVGFFASYIAFNNIPDSIPRRYPLEIFGGLIIGSTISGCKQIQHSNRKNAILKHIKYLSTSNDDKSLKMIETDNILDD